MFNNNLVKIFALFCLTVVCVTKIIVTKKFDFFEILLAYLVVSTLRDNDKNKKSKEIN